MSKIYDLQLILRIEAMDVEDVIILLRTIILGIKEGKYSGEGKGAFAVGSYEYILSEAGLAVDGVPLGGQDEA